MPIHPYVLHLVSELDGMLQDAVEDSMFDFDAVAETIKKHLLEVQPSTKYIMDSKVCRLRFAELDAS